MSQDEPVGAPGTNNNDDRSGTSVPISTGDVKSVRDW